MVQRNIAVCLGIVFCLACNLVLSSSLCDKLESCLCISLRFSAAVLLSSLQFLEVQPLVTSLLCRLTSFSLLLFYFKRTCVASFSAVISIDAAHNDIRASSGKTDRSCTTPRASELDRLFDDLTTSIISACSARCQTSDARLFVCRP